MTADPASDLTAAPPAGGPPAPRERRRWWHLSTREGRPLVAHPHFGERATLLLFVCLAVLLLPLLQSDLWFDEILTWGDYGLRRYLGTVLTSYKVANNHILYSAILWVWLRLWDALAADYLWARLAMFHYLEVVLRLPSLLMGAATVWAMGRAGRRFFGLGGGFMVALLTAFSPIFLSFCWQVRGYSLSIMLGAFATIGALYLWQGERRRGLWWYVPAALLLPWTIPTNLMLSVSLWGFLAWSFWRRGSLRRELPLLGLLGLATAGGLAPYLPILPKLFAVLETTQGWDSGAAVLANLLLALAAQGGMFLLACLALRRQPELRDELAQPLPPGDVRAALPALLCWSLLPAALVALWRAPFPRGFAVYLAAGVFAAMYCYREGAIRRNRYFYLLVFFILSSTLVVSRISSNVTARALRRGEYRQDLLCQFYAGSHDLSNALSYLNASPEIPASTRIFLEYEQFPSAESYWRGLGRDRQQLECLNGGTQFPLRLRREAYKYATQLVLAYNQERAETLYRQVTGQTARLQELGRSGELGVFRVVLPVSGPGEGPLFEPDPPSPGVRI